MSKHHRPTKVVTEWEFMYIQNKILIMLLRPFKFYTQKKVQK